MMRRGFSIVELAIVIAMIGILSLLLFASLRSSQVQARDDERQSKAELIATSLESLYKTGNSSFSHQAGKYPSIATINNGLSAGTLTTLLPNIDDSTLDFSWSDSPGIKLKTLITVAETSPSSNTEKMSYIEPRVGLDEFVYEPLSLVSFGSFGDNDKWDFCRSLAFECRRFNIYYRTEADNQIQVIRSVNQ